MAILSKKLSVRLAFLLVVVLTCCSQVSGKAVAEARSAGGSLKYCEKDHECPAGEWCRDNECKDSWCDDDTDWDDQNKECKEIIAIALGITIAIIVICFLLLIGGIVLCCCLCGHCCFAGRKAMRN